MFYSIELVNLFMKSPKNSVKTPHLTHVYSILSGYVVTMVRYSANEPPIGDKTLLIH